MIKPQGEREVEDMRVSIRKIPRREDEQVILECVEMTKDFEDVREYALMKGNMLNGYIHDIAYQLKLSDILYFEAVGDQVFAYTAEEIYSVKKRLYELEAVYQDRKFIRCSKSVLVNLMQIESFRPALDSRFFARMKNGEDIMVSRMYAKELKKRLMEG